MEALEEIIRIQFPQVDDKGCVHQIEKGKFGIRDDEEGSAAYLVEVEEGQFKIKNPNKKRIGFWQIDDCTFESHQESRCDCGLWDEKKILLLELKANTKGSGGRKKMRKKAKEQLEATLHTLDEMIPAEYERIAVVCFDFQNDYPASRTNSTDAALHFQETYNTALQEGNEFTFS